MIDNPVTIDFQSILFISVHPRQFLNLSTSKECHVTFLIEYPVVIHDDVDELIYCHLLVLDIAVLSHQVVHHLLVLREELIELVVIGIEDDHMTITFLDWVCLDSFQKVLLHIEDRQVSVFDNPPVALEEPKVPHGLRDFQEGVAMSPPAGVDNVRSV